MAFVTLLFCMVFSWTPMHAEVFLSRQPSNGVLCPNQTVTFVCTVSSFSIRWSVTLATGSGLPGMMGDVTFLDDSTLDPNLNKVIQINSYIFNATIVSRSIGAINSTLKVSVESVLNGTRVSCNDAASTNRELVMEVAVPPASSPLNIQYTVVYHSGHVSVLLQWIWLSGNVSVNIRVDTTMEFQNEIVQENMFHVNSLNYNTNYEIAIAGSNCAGQGPAARINLTFVNCSTPISASGVSIEPYSNTTEGAVIYYHCSEGFHSDVRIMAVCVSSGRWNPDPELHNCSNPTLAIRSLKSVPASDGGVLTAGVGQQISLTCSHDNDASVATRWRINASVDCSRSFTHQSGSIGDCGPFSFVNVTQGNTAPFISTAVANATTSMTGAVVQCFDSVGTSAVQVGSNITLCVYDNPPPPANLQCQPMSGGVVEISWSPVPQDCTMSSVYYRINTSIGGNTTIEQGTIFSTSAQFSLTPGEEYVAILTTVVIDTVRSTMRVSESTNCTFTTQELAVLPTTSSNTVQKTELDTTTAVVITFVVTTVIMLIVGVVFGSLATFLIMKKRKSTPEHHSPTDGASGGPFYEQVSPSNATSKEEVEMDHNVAYGHVQQ